MGDSHSGRSRFQTPKRVGGEITQSGTEGAPNRIGLRSPSEPIPGLYGKTVGDFWRWAYSDILSNRNRSIFAEYIVASALGIVGSPRIEWDAVDLRYRGLKIEVKSSAYCQSWFQKKPSAITFSIRKAISWNPESGVFQGEPTRPADVYVFCVHPEKDKEKANVLDVSSWQFYVVSTKVLNHEFSVAKSLSLSAVKRIAMACGFDELKPVDRMPVPRGME